MAADLNIILPKPAQTNNGPYVYPIEDNGYKARIVFQAVEVIPPKFNQSEFLTNADKIYSKFVGSLSSGSSNNPQEQLTDPFGANLFDNSTEGASNYVELESTRQTEKAVSGTTSGETIEPIKVQPIPGGSCSIYMPISYTVNDIISYTQPEIGAGGATALNALNTGSSLFSAALSAVQSGFESFTALLGSGQALNSAAGRLGVSRGIGLIPGLSNFGDVFKIASQVTVNTNPRAVFNGVPLREFNFIFKFIPSSADESQMVKGIIEFFRVNAYPKQINVQGLPLGYEFPNMFKIKLMYNNTRIGTRIKLCYLRNISTNYNPSNMGFHPDGSPVEIDLNLSFVEHRAIHRDDILGNGEYDPEAGTGTDVFDNGEGF